MQAIVLDSVGLAALDAGAWDRLSARALAENPFYDRRHVLAGLDTIDRPGALRAIAIWGGDGELMGLVPYRTRSLLPFPWRIAEGAANLYQFSGIPLVDASAAPAVIDTWLEALSGRSLPRFWSLGDVDLDAPILPLIEAAAARRGLGLRSIGHYRRPRLTRIDGGFVAHAASVIPKRRLRDIERNLRRLRELGTLSFERSSDTATVERRLEDFLALEHAGWKGRLGTSFLSRPADAAFARAAYRHAVIDTLLLGGTPIAVSINLAAGRIAFTPKCTYDERLRCRAPGLVLEYLAVQQFYEASDFAEVDAATTVDGHIVSEFWNDSKRMARLVIGPADWRTDALASAWAQILALQNGAKRVAGRVRQPVSRGTTEPIVMRIQAGVARMLSSLRAGFSGLFGVAMVALPGLLLDFKRHEPLVLGIAGL